jgi:DhnA family fructose-bisphosphate aldolase class Ia
MMNHKQYRMKELLNPADGCSLVVDTSNGLVLGALPGLERFGEAVDPVLPLLDGIVTSPGQARNLGTRTRKDAGLIVRADWTNALRGSDFVLPPDNIEYLPLLGPKDALDMGANALVMHFILGYHEEIEAQCLKRVVNLSLDGISLGMPLIVDVQPIGPRVVLKSKAIELGVSYALEGGADGVAIPWPGWVKTGGSEPDPPELVEALELGAVGFWLDESVFAVDDSLARVQTYQDLLHTLVGAADREAR